MQQSLSISLHLPTTNAYSLLVRRVSFIHHFTNIHPLWSNYPKLSMNSPPQAHYRSLFPKALFPSMGVAWQKKKYSTGTLSTNMQALFETQCTSVMGCIGIIVRHATPPDEGFNTILFGSTSTETSKHRTCLFFEVNSFNVLKKKRSRSPLIHSQRNLYHQQSPSTALYPCTSLSRISAPMKLRCSPFDSV